MGTGPVLGVGAGPVSTTEAVEMVGGAAGVEGLGGRGFGWLVGGKLGRPRLGMGTFTSLVRRGGPSGADIDVGEHWLVGRECINGREGRDMMGGVWFIRDMMGGFWFIRDGRDEGLYEEMVVGVDMMGI